MALTKGWHSAGQFGRVVGTGQKMHMKNRNFKRGKASMQGAAKTSRGTVALMAALMGLFAVMEWLFGAQRLDLALETEALNRGELYRLLLAHTVHLSAYHTGLNIAGVVLVGITVSPVLQPRWFVLSVLASLSAISAGWWLLQAPGITYVGFSGILHGVFAVGALLYLRDGPVWFGWAVVLALGAKLGFEILQGPVPGADAAIAGRVSTLSHALGALGGALVGPWHRLAKPALIALALVALWAAIRHEAVLIGPGL